MTTYRYHRPSPREIARQLRDAVFARDGDRCVYCGRGRTDGVLLTVDHVIPTSKGGDDTLAWVVTACQGCNTRKGARRPDQAGMTWVNPIVGEILRVFDRAQARARARRAGGGG